VVTAGTLLTRSPGRCPDTEGLCHYQLRRSGLKTLSFAGAVLMDEIATRYGMEVVGPIPPSYL
jgi:hypothetical protein